MRDFVHSDFATDVGVAQVKEWVANKEVLLVDVRETNEFEAEHIAGSLLLPLSHFDAEAFPKIPGARIVVQCGIGKRSEAARKMLVKAGHVNVLNMAGGLAAWKEAGFETEV